MLGQLYYRVPDRYWYLQKKCNLFFQNLWNLLQRKPFMVLKQSLRSHPFLSGSSLESSILQLRIKYSSMSLAALKAKRRKSWDIFVSYRGWGWWGHHHRHEGARRCGRARGVLTQWRGQGEKIYSRYTTTAYDTIGIILLSWAVLCAVHTRHVVPITDIGGVSKILWRGWLASSSLLSPTYSFLGGPISICTRKNSSPF